MKTNYYISAAIITSLLINAASACFADEFDFDNCKPYAGFNVMQIQTKFKKEYGGNLFKRNLPSTDIYLCALFNDYFGINIGYYSSAKKIG